MIKRERYLKELIEAKENGFPKVITGIRRCGKSYLLKEIYRCYLLEHGVEASEILNVELDDIVNAKYRNPFELTEYVKKWAAVSSKMHYVFIDEIQLVSPVINPSFTDGKIIIAKPTDPNAITFVDVVLGLSRIANVDLYVTGSNSKLLSKDIATEFRDKATNIHLAPLTFKEFYDFVGGDPHDVFNEYLVYGGMPLAVLKGEAEQKENYLKGLFETTYLKDVLERNKIRKTESLGEIVDALAYASGTLLNTQRIANMLESRKKEKISKQTVDFYLDAFEDAYLISEAPRLDIKGNTRIGATRKYYFADNGLRNARLDFTSLDVGQMVENAVYNELKANGYRVEVGTFSQVEKDKNGKSVLKNYEIDFYATKGVKTFYIQVTDNRNQESTKTRELAPYRLIRDANAKYVLVNQKLPMQKLENGVLLQDVVDFLLSL